MGSSLAQEPLECVCLNANSQVGLKTYCRQFGPVVELIMPRRVNFAQFGKEYDMGKILLRVGPWPELRYDIG